jgi:hypothetical protein
LPYRLGKCCRPSGSYRWWLVAQFVVGGEGEAYDVRAKGPNRKFRLDWRMTQLFAR